VPLFSPRASRASCQKHLTTWASLNSLQISCAMRMLASGLDITTISLWLGHASPAATRNYLHADLALKQRALERTAPPRTRRGRYIPTDKVLAFLEQL
jgi:integrase/recombinase XerD